MKAQGRAPRGRDAGQRPAAPTGKSGLSPDVGGGVPRPQGVSAQQVRTTPPRSPLGAVTSAHLPRKGTRVTEQDARLLTPRSPGPSFLFYATCENLEFTPQSD